MRQLDGARVQLAGDHDHPRRFRHSRDCQLGPAILQSAGSVPHESRAPASRPTASLQRPHPSAPNRGTHQAGNRGSRATTRQVTTSSRPTRNLYPEANTLPRSATRTVHRAWPGAADPQTKRHPQHHPPGPGLRNRHQHLPAPNNPHPLRSTPSPSSAPPQRLTRHWTAPAASP